VTQTQGSITQERLFKYDSLSRLTHERQVEATATLNDAGVKVTSGGLWTGVYAYDTNGLRTDAYDARGIQTHFTYDGLKRVKTVTFTGETNYQTANITYTYDEERTGYFNKGGVTKVETATTSYAPSTTQVYDYDKMNRLSKQQQTIGANGSIAAQTYMIEYGYNLAGQLISQKYPSGRTVNFVSDEAGRVSNIYGGGRTYASGFNYAGHSGLLSVNYGNGVTESFSYNDRLQLTQQSLVKNNSVIQRYDYAYGVVDQSNGNVDSTKNMGQIARIEGYIGGTTTSPDKQWQQRFTYDTVGRLSQSSEYRNDSGTLSLTYKSQFDYDRWGNRYRKASNNPNSLPFTVIEDFDVDKATNRFSSSTNTTYDEAGNVITDNKFRNLSYRYDANSRMVWSQNSNGQGSESKTVYNAMGNRVASFVNGQWRYFVYDIGGNLLAEYGQATITTEKIRYYLQDHQASTRVVMNKDASVISRTDYQAFGEEISSGVGRRTTSQGYSQTENNRQRYAMTERDEATGLEHTWFRKYDNKAGRWTSPDPYKGSMSRGNPQSFNRYSYVQNDPINNADPSGLITCNVTFWFLVSANDTIYLSFTVNYCWGANPDTNGGGSHGTGGQQGQQGQQQKPCDAKLTGDATVDKIAQYFFAESTSGNAETYAWMKATLSNLVAAGLKEFGCNVSDILANTSKADDWNAKEKRYGNDPFNQAASNEGLATLRTDDGQCEKFKKAQEAAKATASALPALGSRNFTTPSGIDWPPLFWRGESLSGSGKGYIRVGDTTFFSHNPNNGIGWGNSTKGYHYKIRKAHSDTPEWACP